VSKKMSPEIKALRAIAKALQSVDHEAHRRMLEWAWSRFVSTPPTARGERTEG
jgi:hypothetical protein